MVVVGMLSLPLALAWVVNRRGGLREGDEFDALLTHIAQFTTEFLCEGVVTSPR